MKKTTGQEQTTVTESPLRLPDAASAMDGVVGKALAYCAEKMGYATFQDAIDALWNGPQNSASRAYLHYSIGQQVAEVLGVLDENVKSVSMFSYDATPEDVTLAENEQPALIHLIVWTERKTAALEALADAFDRNLLKDYVRIVDARERPSLLDVHFITDSDVARRSGVAALVSSLYNPALKIWER